MGVQEIAFIALVTSGQERKISGPETKKAGNKSRPSDRMVPRVGARVARQRCPIALSSARARKMVS